jgi:hypothetical protein
MTPEPFLLNEPVVHKKVPGRRNISQTSLDFSVMTSPKKNPFDLGFEGADLGVDFKVGTMCDNLSSISKHDLDEPLIGLVGEKRLKGVAVAAAVEPELGLFFNDDNDRLEILSLEEGGPSATKRQRLD